MVREQEYIVKHDTYRDAIRAEAESSNFDITLYDFRKRMKANKMSDMDYVDFMCTITKDKKIVSPKKKQEIDDRIVENNSCTSEENDPQYEDFLKYLKAHEKSYVLEHKKCNSLVIIKYEEDRRSDEVCDPKPKRRAIEQGRRLPNQLPSEGNQHNHVIESISAKNVKDTVQEFKNRKVEEVTIPTCGMMQDMEYLTFIKSSKLVDDYFVCTYGGKPIIYEKILEESNCMEDNSEEEHSSDVQIIDSSFFYKGADLNSSDISSYKMKVKNSSNENQHGFRKQLIEILTKPYDKQEYAELWQDIRVRKPEARHMDLRGGRPFSYSTAKLGKSYLDRYPDLKKILLQIKDDKPKCLNLLRGFFFWLQKLTLDDVFMPWRDAQCKSIDPGSQHSGISIKLEKN